MIRRVPAQPEQVVPMDLSRPQTEPLDLSRRAPAGPAPVPMQWQVQPAVQPAPPQRAVTRSLTAQQAAVEQAANRLDASIIVIDSD